MGEQTMTIEEQIDNEIKGILSDLQQGILTKNEAEELIKELGNVRNDLNRTEKQIIASYITDALQIVAKFI